MKTDGRPPQDALPNGVATPAEFDDAIAWVAWLYYADRLTQSDIAKALKVSRATIVKMLQEARERGAVAIRLNPEATARTEASRALAAKHRLEAAYVIPDLPGAALIPRLGEAGARVLAANLVDGDVIGAAWGRAVLSVAEAMGRPERPGRYAVVQICGSSPGGASDFSPELCSSILASRIGARCANLLAPAVLSSTQLRDRLLAEPALVSQFQLIRSANRVLFGVGDVGKGSTVRASGLASAATIDGYARRGAVAVLIGRFIDRDGRPVPGELDGRMIGITLDELTRLPNRLCIAGGPDKVEALRAALWGGYVTHLVTDARTAAELLA
jgi:DNA-binding transcriptional regulator LsrR (DeoR family)